MNLTVISGKQLSKMTLGTVQLGMNYGIANQGGQPNTVQSNSMLSYALENGVTSLDTAGTYGTSEDILGKFLRYQNLERQPFLTSKLTINLPNTANQKSVEEAMYHSVETSLERLGVSKLDCLLLHQPEDMTKHGKIVPKVMEQMVVKGYTSMAGVSVYLPEELDIMMQNDVYQATQVPMNLFDQKLIERGYINTMQRKNIVVFVRSVFLQGLFFLEPDKITDPLLNKYAYPHLVTLRTLCREADMSIAELAISFIRDIPGVTSLVLGADTKEQVIDNIHYMNAPQLSDKMRQKVTEVFRTVNIEKIMEVLRRPKQ